jgi:hypothetical protein
MSNWVLSNNPTTTYRAKQSLETDDGVMDWIARNKFEIGDVVYIYEVLPPNGRGGIVYKTEVTLTGLTLDTKIDDRECWVGGDYPEYITDRTRFNRLKLIGGPANGKIPYSELKEVGFIAPQVGAHRVDSKPSLLKFIEKRFK